MTAMDVQSEHVPPHSNEAHSHPSHSHPYFQPRKRISVTQLAANINVNVILKGLPSAYKSETTDVYCPQVRRSASTDHQHINHLDVVSCWKQLSFRQAAEIARWESLFKTALESQLRNTILQAIARRLDRRQSRRYAPAQEPLDSATIASSLIDFTSTDTRRLIAVDAPELVYDIIARFYEDDSNFQYDWFKQSGNLPAAVYNLLRTRDCFLATFPYPSLEVSFTYEQSAAGVIIFGDVNWHPPHIDFSDLPIRLHSGAEYRIRPQYKEPDFGSKYGPRFEKFVVKPVYVVTSQTVPVSWDANLDCFRAVVSNKNHMQPIVERVNGSEKELKVITTQLSAKIVMKFPGNVRFEVTTRYNLKLEIAPLTLESPDKPHPSIPTYQIEPDDLASQTSATVNLDLSSRSERSASIDSNRRVDPWVPPRFNTPRSDHREALGRDYVSVDSDGDEDCSSVNTSSIERSADKFLAYIGSQTHFRKYSHRSYGSHTDEVTSQVGGLDQYRGPNLETSESTEIIMNDLDYDADSDSLEPLFPTRATSPTGGKAILDQNANECIGRSPNVIPSSDCKLPPDQCGAIIQEMNSENKLQLSRLSQRLRNLKADTVIGKSAAEAAKAGALQLSGRKHALITKAIAATLKRAEALSAEITSAMETLAATEYVNTATKTLDAIQEHVDRLSRELAYNRFERQLQSIATYSLDSAMKLKPSKADIAKEEVLDACRSMEDPVHRMKWEDRLGRFGVECILQTVCDLWIGVQFQPHGLPDFHGAKKLKTQGDEYNTQELRVSDFRDAWSRRTNEYGPSSSALAQEGKKRKAILPSNMSYGTSSGFRAGRLAINPLERDTEFAAKRQRLRGRVDSGVDMRDMVNNEDDDKLLPSLANITTGKLGEALGDPSPPPGCRNWSQKLNEGDGDGDADMSSPPAAATRSRAYKASSSSKVMPALRKKGSIKRMVFVGHRRVGLETTYPSPSDSGPSSSENSPVDAIGSPNGIRGVRITSRDSAFRTMAPTETAKEPSLELNQREIISAYNHFLNKKLGKVPASPGSEPINEADCRIFEKIFLDNSPIGNLSSNEEWNTDGEGNSDDEEDYERIITDEERDLSGELESMNLEVKARNE